jgi:hypothetical protein
MKTNEILRSVSALCVILIPAVFAGCVGRDRVDLKADLVALQSGQLSMGFEEVNDHDVRVRGLEDDARQVVLKAFAIAVPVNREVVEISEPKLMILSGDSPVGFVTLSSVDGQFLVSFQAYELDASCKEWGDLKSLFEDERNK